MVKKCHNKIWRDNIIYIVTNNETKLVSVGIKQNSLEIQQSYHIVTDATVNHSL